ARACGSRGDAPHARRTRGEDAERKRQPAPRTTVAEGIASGGVLYVVATPIGNLEDVTLRALRVLREVDVVAAEDTRRTRVLLRAHGIEATVVSYYDAVERRRASELVARMRAGGVVGVVGSRGCPGIPGSGNY